MDKLTPLFKTKRFWLAAIGLLAAYGILAPDQANALRWLLDALADSLVDMGVLSVPPTPTVGP